ncbi:hypothetical protein BHE90_015062 [Fusarium euwallaceae]|uniref:Uncharacterized protein n=1 Tax=Fusarium euwallaceae TaxID=1147111 RepID=A0A430L479_9HYPO|nr:hypothetical protein BHE90_015062 [Fusarium euwallaceae]
MIMATRFSPEAFLPSGAYDTDVGLTLNDPLVYSHVSHPNSYPRAGTLRHQYPQHYLNSCQNNIQHQNQRGWIPPASTMSLQPSETSPQSLAALRATQSVPPRHSSLRFQPESLESLKARPATVSPTYGGPPPIHEHRLPPSSTAPLPSVSSGLVGASLSRSVSADAVAPSQSPSHVVQRLVQQNAMIREAWEAERNHLEANRRRAEEVYQEERIIMDEVRVGWETEKENMIREIEDLKERMHRLEGENSALKAVAAQSIQVTGMVSPLASQRGGSGDGSLENSYFSAPPGRLTSRSQNPTIPASLSTGDASSLPPGLDGASRRPHFLSPGSSRLSPITQPESSPFVPLDPRMQTQNPVARDFLSSPSDDATTPVPVIDVQEIDPKLEGIPLKATAVQKSTFADGATSTDNPSSPIVSPPGPATQHPERIGRPSNVRGSSKEFTLQALSAVESRRLTMHAGHTPNHSLSLFPSVNPTDTDTIVGEGATPTVETVIDLAAALPEEPVKDPAATVVQTARRDSKVSFAAEELDIDHPEPVFEPDEDKPLKGPLMIRNMPAKDELFWEAVNKKLEPISQGQNALPAVMQTSLEDLEAGAGPSGLNAQAQKRQKVPHVGGDGSVDAQADAEDSGNDSETSDNGIDADVPLKFKATSNFGAPFGAM